MSAFQSDKVVSQSVFGTKTHSEPRLKSLAAWLLVFVILYGYFALCGYIVTHGSVDQSSPATSEAITSNSF